MSNENEKPGLVEVVVIPPVENIEAVKADLLAARMRNNELRAELAKEQANVAAVRVELAVEQKRHGDTQLELRSARHAATKIMARLEAVAAMAAAVAVDAQDLRSRR